MCAAVLYTNLAVFIAAGFLFVKKADGTGRLIREEAMRILVLGGSGSGKSEYAEQCVLEMSGGRRFYLATMEPFGKEGQARIDRHRKMREEKGFETVEQYRDLAGLVLEKPDTVLLECVGNLMANEMFGPKAEEQEKAKEKVLEGIRALGKQAENLVVVSNDLGSDGIEYPRETEDYIQAMGHVNRVLAKEFDQVVEVVCGIPVLHKGGRKLSMRGRNI